LVGIFSHLPWDAALEPEQALYGNFYDWLDDTIEVASQKEETQFILKAHPAEKIRGTNEGVGNWIEENHAPLPDNIDFLPPDTDVNTYALIEDLDAGIVYASTVGLEMALDGVPVLVGGYPPYHGFGITHDPSSKSEYIEKLQNIENLEHGEERQKRAWRFAYFHFICKHLDFPPLAKPEEEVHLEHEDFVGEGSVYASIVDQILNGEAVIQPGCMGLK
jgi:capsule polysaccharide export protein KpsC/LpsZ